MPLFEYINADNTGMIIGGFGVRESLEMEAAEQDQHDIELVDLKIEEHFDDDSAKSENIGRIACKAGDLETKAS